MISRPGHSHQRSTHLRYSSGREASRIAISFGFGSAMTSATRRVPVEVDATSMPLPFPYALLGPCFGYPRAMRLSGGKDDSDPWDGPANKGTAAFPGPLIPVLASTRATVRISIFRSSWRDPLSTYQQSSSNFSPHVRL